jgi:hypothetical protein
MKKKYILLMGSPKCGTTSIYDFLSKSQYISCYHSKEPNFFATDISNISSKYKNNLDSDNAFMLDGTTSYLRSDTFISKINSLKGDLYLFLFRRNYLNQIISIYGQLSKSRTQSDLSKILINDWNEIKENKISPQNILHTAATAKHFLSKIDFYIQNKTYLFYFDRYITDSEVVNQEICNFLSISDLNCSELSHKNTGIFYKPSRIFNIANTLYSMKNRLRIPSFGMMGLIRNIFGSIEGRPDLSQDAKKVLLEFYKSEQIALQQIIKLWNNTNDDKFFNSWSAEISNYLASISSSTTS